MTTVSPYQIKSPSVVAVPILISVPHCGTAIPDNIKGHYRPSMIESISDTDFYVDRLYQFASDMGITIITAHYSRWVIDLNRSSVNEELYKDGRIITSLTPTTDFEGNQIYKKESYAPDQEEINQRLQMYYQPYHDKITDILQLYRDQHGVALLWDAHSIKRFVPKIHHIPFPDLVLGTNDETSATLTLIESTLRELKSSGLSVAHNHPFKGGHITRHFGQPLKNIHALQLEMSKDCYMDEEQVKYSKEKSINIQVMLRQTFTKLIDILLAD